MTSLHHARPVDDGRDVAPASPAATHPATRVNSRRRAGDLDGKTSARVPQQRQGKASRTGLAADRSGAGRSTAELVTAAGSLAARARAVGEPDTGAVVPAFVDEALARLPAEPAEPAEAATADRRSRRTGRRRMPLVRRRPTFYLAAGLVGALSVGAFVDTDPSARADAPAVAQAVSVAEQLGIEAEPTEALADAESTRLLQGLVASRNERDAASTAAADAQAQADFFAAVAAAEAAAEAARPKVVAPVNGARLTSGFGARWGTVHTGIDLAAPMRTPEHAVMDGVVVEAGPASGYGLAVFVRHHNGDVTLYGHMDEILVEPGQVVRAGDTIALLGNRGQSTGPHLHFEVHVGGMNGTKVDPLPWLRERGVRI